VVTTGVARLGVLAGAACLVLSGAVPSQAAGSSGWRVVARFTSPHAAVQMDSVTALSTRDAWAVGTAQRITARGIGPGTPLVVRWNGAAWRTVTLPLTARRALGSGFSFALAASSASNVWVTGQQGWARWTGHGWQTGKLPTAGRGGPVLAGWLLVFGPRDVWLLGSYTAGTRISAFARRYDGSRWRVMPAPSFTNFLVSGASPTAICAMNGQPGSAISAVTQLACWNGRRWLREVLPVSLNEQHAIIGGLLVRSLSDIWIGGANVSVAVGQPGLAAHWNGHLWRVQTLPTVTTLTVDVLSHLTPDGHGGMWAIGECNCGGPAWRLWHYTGGTWIGPTLPAIGGTFNVLHAIAAVPGTSSTWAVATRGTATGSDGVVLLKGPIPR
jgi:hypothetical protein